MIITDTVGFIRDLPPDLIAGFKATLEEIREATVLLHVVDASSPAVEDQIAAVREILEELGLGDKAECLVLNKSDLVAADEVAGLAHLLGGVSVSALDGRGIEELLQRLEPMMFRGEPGDDLRLAAGS